MYKASIFVGFGRGDRYAALSQSFLGEADFPESNPWPVTFGASLQATCLTTWVIDYYIILLLIDQSILFCFTLNSITIFGIIIIDKKFPLLRGLKR